MDDIWNGIVVFLFVAGCLFLTAWLFCSGIALKKNHYLVERPKTLIYSLGDNTSATGTFILGSGSVNEEWQYTYYYKTSDGFMIDSVPSEDYVIVEDDTVSPQIRTIYKCVSKDTKVFIFTIKRDDYCKSIRNEIVVPSNTIKQTYNLDTNK